METPKAYVPINCWKCNAQNNAAITTVCRVCQAYLRTEGNETPLSHGFTDHPAFKGYLLFGLVLLLAGIGLIYFYKSPQSDSYASTVTKETTLPADSWYNNSLWSYVSNSPSVRQILQKYKEANGETPSLATARTFSLSGKMSHAVGTCFEQACLDELQRRFVEEQRRVSQGFRLPVEVIKRIGEERKPETSDKYDNLGFSEFGKLELLVKIPGKMVKKATANNPHDQSQPRVEVTEFFNGVEGKRITDYFDALDNKVKSEVDIMDAQQLETARLEQAQLLGKDFDNYTDMEFRGLEKVNERVAFKVRAKNQKGDPETFFFDAVKGFLIKVDTPFNTLFLDDYRPWGHGMLPYTVYLRQPELGGFHSWIKIQIAEWKIGDPIDDLVFEIPAGS